MLTCHFYQPVGLLAATKEYHIGMVTQVKLVIPKKQLDVLAQ